MCVIDVRFIVLRKDMAPTTMRDKKGKFISTGKFLKKKKFTVMFFKKKKFTVFFF